MKRVVFTVAIGSAKYGDMAKGLAQSLSLIGDTTHRVLMTDIMRPDLHRSFDTIVPPDSSIPPYLSKLQALQCTDADAVLFIDADSLAFKKLDPIFEYCSGKPLAVQGAPTREGYWYGRLSESLPRLGLEEILRFNGGMIYYERGLPAERLLAEARNVAANYAETGLDMLRGQVPDEPCLAIAMARTGLGELVPDELGFMNTAVGLVGPLRMDVMKGECKFVCRRHSVRFVEPYIFHASRYANFFIYWRQLTMLQRLEEYEDRYGYGYMSAGQKLKRSIQRRWLKYVAKKL